ncbi:hypothetical protein 276BB001_75 [Bacillus phage 276BB001]|nr:hypothetical protein 276BB001_75 [Bacillus phage 276BB001]QFG05994.1 hypothetical protein 280BB001_75 [Bacillus phage 280BB001]QZA70143.1 hypothetical protein 274BB002_75 [Bacillus phage 274BB002]
MANLNGENYVRMVPKLTQEQLEAIRRLRDMSDKGFLVLMRNYGNWNQELSSLNSVSVEDILYTVVTGEYELKVDDYEAYLIQRVEHFQELYNVHKDVSAKSNMIVASNALSQYRKFRANEEVQK